MRNFFAKTKGLWGILTLVFMLVLVFAVTVGAILEENKGMVNNYLGTRTDEVVVDGDSETYTTYTPAYTNTDDLIDEHESVGTELEREGSVLLKNTGSALPLKASSEKITIFGAASSSKDGVGFYGMGMGANVSVGSVATRGSLVTLYDALTARGASVNKDMYDDIESQTASMSNSLSNSNYTHNEMTVDVNMIGNYTDVGIVVLGRISSEMNDWKPDSMGTSGENTGARYLLSLTDKERALITASETYCSKTVVVINACNPMEIGELVEDDKVDAILWIGFPGNYGYYGVADVLLGNSNPSGRLVDTYASDSTSSPAMQNYGVYQFANRAEAGIDSSSISAQYYLVEAEGIYTGYKYYETRYEDSVLDQGKASSMAGAFDSTSGWNYDEEVVYSFGEGISYTTFSQKIKDVDFTDGYRTAEVKVEVTNTGSVAGKSVVQVYGQSPYTNGGIEKASVQLLDYAKTGTIEAGKTEDVTVEIDMQLLASYDSSANNGEGTYVMEAGDYYFALGCNGNQEGAHAAVNNVLAAKGKTPANTNNVMDAEGSTDATYKFAWSNGRSDLFSTSKAGVKVKNELEDADLNYWYKDYVTYLSRSDWEWKDSNGVSKWNTSAWSSDNMKGYTNLNVTSGMAEQLMNATYEIQTDDDVSGILFNQDNGLVFANMINEDGSVVDYDDYQWDLLLDQLDVAEACQFIAQGNRTYPDMESVGFLGGTYTENGPSGVKLNGIGGDSPWVTSLLESDSENTNYDSKDGYAWNDCPGAMVQASTWNKDLIERLGEMWGNDALYTDIAIIWGPSINTHRHPYNGRTAEYFSEDPIVSGYSAVALNNGSEKYGLICAVKHYAFNDQEANRNGMAPFMNEQKARENELRGFQIAFEGGLKATMTAFNRVGCTYVGADMGLMQGILRGEWGYNGYVVSDMRNSAGYMTFTESVLAGTTNFDGRSWSSERGASTAAEYADMISGDATMLQAVKDAVHSSLWTFAHTNVANYMVENAHTEYVMNWWRATYITLEVIGGVVAGVSFVLWVVAEVIGKKKEDGEEE